MTSEKRIQSEICTADEKSITIRGKNLSDEIIGEDGFGEYIYFHFTGSEPTESEARMINALLVTPVEHGITPSVMAARLTYDSAPEAVQGAVASGLLGAGSTFLGSMEDISELLYEGVDQMEDDDPDRIARDIVEREDRLPGFGHPIHSPVDPRTARLFELLEEEGMAGEYYDLIQAIHDRAQEVYNADMMINATGAIGTCICEMGLNPKIGRGLALVSRAAGLVGHINEEIDSPLARDLWDVVAENSDYTGEL